MKDSLVKVICFSPTGSSRKIAEVIAGTINPDYNVIDLSLPRDRENIQPLFSNELAILAAPVYFGRVEATAAKVFATLKANSTPVVLLAVYGNRHFDDALAEMVDIAVSRGFTPIAAGAFIAAHSFDSPAHPIATGRPDVEDLAKARIFGQAIAEKLSKTTNPQLPDILSVPGNRPYRDYGRIPVTPESSEACIRCGVCVTICPVAAITSKEQTIATDSTCIFCHACVNACPQKARNCSDPKMLESYQRMSTLLTERRQPQWFI